jgi:EXLDI family protein
VNEEEQVPNKTIYVSDEDLPLFERAQELSGANLSSAIVRSLRRFIELEEAKQRGFEEITVIVNTRGTHRRKRFVGQRLVRWIQPTADKEGTDVLNVYRTAGKRFALHTRSVPDWPIEGGDPDYAGDPKNWGLGNGLLKRIASWGYDWEEFKESGTYTFQIFENLEELKPHISAELYTMVNQAMQEPEIEELDI